MNRGKISLLFFVINLWAFQKLCAQAFTYQQVPLKYSNISLPSNKERASVEQAFNGSYKITSSLPANYVKDGSVDYTSFIQGALDKYSKVIFPDFPVLINESGLTIRSNSKLYFPLGSKLLLRANNKGTYEMVRIHMVSNVSLYYPVLVGDRKRHSDTGGEWGMGLSIRDSKNILIQKPKIDDCWGDGIYLGQVNNPNINIHIVNPFLDDNRRNGISIISAKGMKIDNAVISNTNGTSPMAGIDFEPNSNSDVIDSISIDKPITFNNGSHGILFALGNQSGKEQRNINIEINNPIDEQSVYGLSLLLKQDASKPFTPKGLIKIKSPVWKNNKIRSLYFYPGNLDNSVMVNISNLNIVSDKPDQLMNIKKELKENNKNILLQ
jgi:hypothetical protein